MASININFEDCGKTLYRYKIQRGSTILNYIYMITLDIPYTLSEIKGKSLGWYFNHREQYEFNSNNLNISDIKIPLWGVIQKDIIPIQFLEIYKDDWFEISSNVDGTSKGAGLTMTCGTYDGDTFIGSGTSFNTSSADGAYSTLSVFPHFVKTSDNHFLVENSNRYTNAWFASGISISAANDMEVPNPGTAKGSCIALNNISMQGLPSSGTTNSIYDNYIQKLIGKFAKYDSKDPNTGGGDSSGGGGGGNGDIGGDTNTDDGLPDISALDSGLLTAYNPNVSELQALGRFLWSDSFDVNAFKKLFNDPFDTLLGLSIVPVAPKTSGSKHIMFGNLDSGISAAVVSNQWVSMDMGTLHLNEVWKGALDYAPSTGVCIYLPFIGMRQLNVNDVMGSALHLIYKFDVLTGSVIAQLYVDHDNRGNPSQGFSYTKNMGLCYEFIGQCGENIPLASQDFTNTIRAAITGVSVAAGAAASVATGNPALGIAALTVGAANAGMQANTPTVERGGHLSGSASIMGYSQPFLIVERPHQCKPSRYYSLRGIPSQVYTSKLANCTGFTQITNNNNIHASGAQDAELEEIERLLTSGVYFPNNVRS